MKYRGLINDVPLYPSVDADRETIDFDSLVSAAAERYRCISPCRMMQKREGADTGASKKTKAPVRLTSGAGKVVIRWQFSQIDRRMVCMACAVSIGNPHI